MIITEVKAIPIKATRSKTMLSAPGMTLSASEFGIVLIDTKEGLQGIGEISMNGGRAGLSLCADVNREIAPLLVGRDATEIRSLIGLMDWRLHGAESEAAKSGVEMALLDLLGKALNCPVYQLLGGKARSGVSVAWVIGYGDPTAAAEEAAEYVSRGFSTIKLKVGRPNSDEDEQTVRAVREAIGDEIPLKLDANEGYRTPMEAVTELRKLEAYGLQLIEQPLKARHLEGLAFIKSRLDTPLLADESMYVWHDALSLAKSGACDVLNVYVSESGGLLAASKAFAIGEAAGMPALVGSQCELGIGTAAGAHLAVAMPNLGYTSDLVGALRYPQDIINETLRYEQGVLYPPEGPGLGVTINLETLEAWRLDR